MNKIIVTILLLSFPIFTKAALYERLNGKAYYDDIANLTWLANGNYAEYGPLNDGGYSGPIRSPILEHSDHLIWF